MSSCGGYGAVAVAAASVVVVVGGAAVGVDLWRIVHDCGWFVTERADFVFGAPPPLLFPLDYLVVAKTAVNGRQPP